MLPLALWHSGSDEKRYALARRHSLVTHGHLRSQLCCAFYSWARAMAGDSAAEEFLAFGDLAVVAHESKFILMDSHQDYACGSGYVLNSPWSARIAMRETDYPSVVRAAIAFGDDTHTTACLAGGLAGIRDGLAAIPGSCRNSLRGREIYEPLVEKLLAGRCGV